RERTEIAFVDCGVSNIDELLRGLRADVEPIVLDPATSASAQIARTLTERADVGVVHIVAHGRPGEVSFASGSLSLATIADQAAELAAIGRALGEDGDLLLWSCNTGDGECGAALVQELAHVIAANVAAASGRVGAAALGGRWTLDAQSAAMDVRAPLTAHG